MNFVRALTCGIISILLVYTNILIMRPVVLGVYTNILIMRLNSVSARSNLHLLWRWLRQMMSYDLLVFAETSCIIVILEWGTVFS
jgi:hypothetical protein